MVKITNISHIQIYVLFLYRFKTSNMFYSPLLLNPKYITDSNPYEIQTIVSLAIFNRGSGVLGFLLFKHYL